MSESIETVIVGGGQAGLAMSYYLSQCGREHIVYGAGEDAQYLAERICEVPRVVALREVAK